MSLKDIKEFKSQLEQQGVDTKQPYIIDSVVSSVKKRADKQTVSITQAALLEVDMDYESQIKALIEERDNVKAALRENKNEELEQTANIQRRITSFYGLGKQLASAILDSRAGRYVPMDWKVEQKLDALDTLGFDLYDDETYATLFSADICGVEGLEISTRDDFQGHLYFIDTTNKHMIIKKEFDKILPAYNALHEVAENDEFSSNILANITEFQRRMDVMSKSQDMGTKEAYGRFFYEMDNITTGPVLTSKDEFDALAAELTLSAKNADLGIIANLYETIKTTDYSDENFVSTIQTNCIALEDKIVETATRFNLEQDDVCSAALSDAYVDTMVGLNSKLKAYNYQINIRDILGSLKTIKAPADKSLTKVFIEQVEALDLSETRLKTAGISQETITDINALKDQFITALAANEDTRGIEREIGTLSINAHAQMERKSVKQLTR